MVTKLLMVVEMAKALDSNSKVPGTVSQAKINTPPHTHIYVQLHAISCWCLGTRYLQAVPKLKYICTAVSILVPTNTEYDRGGETNCLYNLCVWSYSQMYADYYMSFLSSV